MALTKDKLMNIALFMEQAPHGTGLQARAWAQTYEAVLLEVEALDKKAAKKSAETPAGETK